MPKTRSAGLPIRPLNYEDYDSSSGEEDHDFEAIASILGFFSRSRSARRRRSAGKTKKKRGQPTACTCHGPKATQKRKGSPQKQQNKGRGRGAKAAKVSLLSEENKPLVIESDDETAAITTTQTNVIKDKVNNFFKDLESDEEIEENSESKEVPNNNLPEKNSRDFYTLSDSDNDEESKKRQQMISVLTKDVASPKPSTSSSGSILNTEPKIVADNVDTNPDKNVEDLFAYVDNVLSECDQVVDITEDNPKENVPVMSLEDLKKKTDEILGGVASLIDTFKPKEPEKKPIESPVKETPMCPVCFEPFGSSRQAMATLCGHMFCNLCLLEIVKKTKKCPTCRKGLTKNKYHPIYI